MELPFALLWFLLWLLWLLRLLRLLRSISACSSTACCCTAHHGSCVQYVLEHAIKKEMTN
eukprot:13200-Amphidinium_carterae.1